MLMLAKVGIHQSAATWPGQALSAALIGVAVLTILVALFVHNPWIKAGVLAWEVLP